MSVTIIVADRDAARRRRAESAAEKRESLVSIPESKYSGECGRRECRARLHVGDRVFWDSKTKETFCNTCGELMSA